jgi:hypothetical protein
MVRSNPFYRHLTNVFLLNFHFFLSLLPFFAPVVTACRVLYFPPSPTLRAAHILWEAITIFSFAYFILVLLQNVLLWNVLNYKTSFLQNVLPHNVLPQNVLPQNVHPYKTSFYTKRPPLQNVLPQNVHRYKMSFTTKRHPSMKKNLYIYTIISGNFVRVLRQI